MAERVSLRVQMTKTFGLSQPSRSAEWLKINRSGSSVESSRSLLRMISSYALSSSLLVPVVFLAFPLESSAKYPPWTSSTEGRVSLAYLGSAAALV